MAEAAATPSKLVVRSTTRYKQATVAVCQELPREEQEIACAALVEGMDMVLRAAVRSGAVAGTKGEEDAERALRRAMRVTWGGVAGNVVSHVPRRHRKGAYLVLVDALTQCSEAAYSLGRQTRDVA